MTPDRAYEADIEPRLLELAALCKLRGLSFVAQVELEPGKSQVVSQLGPRASNAVLLTKHAAESGGSYDRMAVTFSAACRRRSGP